MMKVSDTDSGSGQVMAYINDPQGRLCDWGFPRIECYGVRLPLDYQGDIPDLMTLTTIPEAEYLVLNMDHLIMNRKTAVLRNKLKKPWQNLISRKQDIVTIQPHRGESYISILIQSGFGNIFGLCVKFLIKTIFL